VSQLLKLFFLLAVFQTGCAQVLGTLRPDFDDGYSDAESATSGGMLSDFDGYHSQADRGVASWETPSSRNANLRDRARDQFRNEEEALNAEERIQGSNEEQPGFQLPKRMTRADLVDAAEDAGSLWSSSGESNFFFSKNKTRAAGELVTINIEAEFLRDVAAEVKRTLRREERDYELSQLKAPGSTAQAPSAAPNTDQVKQTAAAPDQDGRASFAQVDLQGVIGVKAGDTFLAEVVERYPNGNYKIRGTKRIPYRGTSKLMTLVGIVRGSDLSDDDKVNSGKLYEYRLEVVR
jgi:flagellar L-ring protein precursor FlgH